MTLLADFVEVPESIENINITQELRAMLNSAKYKAEHDDFVEINDRLIVISRGTIPGTVDLFGFVNLPDDQLSEPDWTIVYMGRPTKQMYALKFKGDEQQCLRDIMLLRLQA